MAAVVRTKVIGRSQIVSCLVVGGGLLVALGASRLAAGRGTGSGPPLVVFGGLTLALLVAHPRFAIGATMVLAATFFWTPLFPISFLGSRSDAAEVVVGIVIVVHGARALRDTWRNPYVVAAALLALTVVSGALVSLLRGTPRPNVIGYSKAFGFYLLIIPISFIFRDAAAKNWLERFVLWFAGICSALTVLALVVGYQLEGRPGFTFDPNDVTQSDRVRPPFLAVLFLATLLLVSHIATRGLTFRRLVLLALYLSAWGLSFNRSSWVALLVATGCYLIRRPGPRRAGRGLALALVLAAALPVTFAFADQGALGAVPQGVARRLTTIGEGSVLRSDSYDDRAKEYTDARDAIARSPVFGVGVASPFGARRARYDVRLERTVYNDRLFSHNSWLFLYLELGLPGVIAMAVLIAQAVRQARRSAESSELAIANRATAAGAALLGAGLEALFNPNLLGRPSIIALAIGLTLLTPPASGDEPADARTQSGMVAA